MVRATLMVLAIAGLAACFDPTVPAECAGAVCGEIQDPPEGGGGTTGANQGGGGMMMGMGGGGFGGSAGGAGGIGGAGGAGPLTITIQNPVNGNTYAHGNPIDFAAVVTGGSPANDEIRWTISTQAGIFGIGFTHIKTINVIDTHTLTAAVMQGDTPIATDTITFDTN